MANKDSFQKTENLLKLFARILIPLTLFVGGVLILIFLKNIWGFILGAPSMVFGAVILVYTYDEVVSKTILPEEGKTANCSICGRLTPLLPGQNKADAICIDCQDDIERGLKKERVDSRQKI